jgi:hypothetical protein
MQALLLFLTLVSTSSAVELTTREDIDADQTQEHIRLQILPSGKYTLFVGKSSVRGSFPALDSFDEPKINLRVVDLDTRDKSKEIEIHIISSGDSMLDANVVFYRQVDNKLKKIFSTSSSSVPAVQGNGVLYVTRWMGFWNRLEKYSFDKNQKVFLPVEQAFFYVGTSATISSSIRIYKERNTKKIVAKLIPESQVVILLADPQAEWFLIKSVTGLLGWVHEDALSTNIILPNAG